ncbi:hypothetical protein HOF78_03655 [Candidatus Woesearchaeota archaeon]|jgi:hypothetical protein|nr:hypothetical protein [Candidatus Woesearchaeota archaeon]MBT6044638.1 hypothetical protein [Candidatus Woesearchaeota archaeon]
MINSPEKINNPLFLELYGALLGDGWIGRYINKKKDKEYPYYLLGISGDSRLDKDYFDFLSHTIGKLFGIHPTIRKKKLENTIELRAYNEKIVKYLNSELNFPIGKKGEFKIKREINNEWGKVKHVIRGIFDTDGSIYFDKTPVGRPYPTISISITSRPALKQIRDNLLKQGFKVQNRKDRPEIKLKGRKQLEKWMKEIGCRNNRHFSKYKKFIQGPVAQLG